MKTTTKVPSPTCSCSRQDFRSVSLYLCATSHHLSRLRRCPRLLLPTNDVCSAHWSQLHEDDFHKRPVQQCATMCAQPWVQSGPETGACRNQDKSRVFKEFKRCMNKTGESIDLFLTYSVMDDKCINFICTRYDCLTRQKGKLKLPYLCCVVFGVQIYFLYFGACRKKDKTLKNSCPREAYITPCLCSLDPPHLLHRDSLGQMDGEIKCVTLKINSRPVKSVLPRTIQTYPAPWGSVSRVKVKINFKKINTSGKRKRGERNPFYFMISV